MSESIEQTDNGALDQPLNRRGFFKYILVGFSALATVAGTVGPAIAYLWPPERGSAEAGGRVAVATSADLPVGKGAVYSVNNKPVIVIHTADGYYALSAICTHLACIVFWDEQRGMISCPCHAAFFNVNGAVVSGPPPEPLAAYRVQLEGDQIYVEGGEG